MRERWAFVALGAAMLVIAAVYLIVRPTSEPPPLPDDPIALARRLRAHPTDWNAASALTEHALDARVPNRFALWRAAHDAAMRLAPTRVAPRMELVRSALFHWQELTPADRQAALEMLGPLLRDRPTFFQMARPLFELTGDLTLLRRFHPDDEQAIGVLVDLAATNGRFAEYRELREELARKRIADVHAKIARLTPVEIVNALPPPPYDTSLEPLLAEVLAELHRRPLTEDPHRAHELDAFVDYTLRHRLGPLDGIDAIVKMPEAVRDFTRYRLAQAAHMDAAAFDIRISAKTPLADPKRGEWQGLDNGNVRGPAWVELETRGPLSIAVEAVKHDEVPPYVEIYVDDARVAEGEVDRVRTFVVPAGPGTHRLSMRVANGWTRNHEPRAVRVSVAP